MQSIIVAFAAPLHTVGRQCIPLFASNLARLAANAERDIGEEGFPLYVTNATGVSSCSRVPESIFV